MEFGLFYSKKKEKKNTTNITHVNIKCFSVFLYFLQINELSHVQIPIMLMPDDFKAYSKIKVDNHLFNKYGPSSLFIQACIAC